MSSQVITTHAVITPHAEPSHVEETSTRAVITPHTEPSHVEETSIHNKDPIHGNINSHILNNNNSNSNTNNNSSCAGRGGGGLYKTAINGVMRNISTQILNCLASEESLLTIASNSNKIRDVLILPALRSIREQLMPYIAATLVVTAILVILAIASLVFNIVIFFKLMTR
jgi:hypothetical protein